MRMPSQPLASQMKFGAAAQETSRTLAAWKRQVRVAPVPAGSSAAVPTSARAMMWMVVSECTARPSRRRCSAGRTCAALARTPVPVTV